MAAHLRVRERARLPRGNHIRCSMVPLAEAEEMNRDDRADDAVFEQAVRETAYFLWEQDGRPEGRAEEYWRRALERHRNQRHYDRWLDEPVHDVDKDSG